MWGDIQDIFLFGCPKTIDITGFFKKFCIATRTMADQETADAPGPLLFPVLLCPTFSSDAPALYMNNFREFFSAGF